MSILDCIEHFITEMAESKKEVEQSLRNIRKPVYEHFIKILKWDDDRNYHKHIDDINTWLQDINYPMLLMKGAKGSKRVPEKTYLQFLFEDKLGEFIQVESKIKMLNKNYGSLPVILSDYEVYESLKEIYTMLCSDLSSGEFTTIEFYLPNNNG